MPTSDDRLPGNTDTRLVVLCDAYAYSLASFRNAIADVDSYARFFPVRLLSYVALPIHELGNREEDCKPGTDKQACGARQETAPSVAGMVSAFANYLLPVLFGVVGALAGLGRIIQDKIRDSLLFPRDMLLLKFRMLFGCIAGASVGLFFDPTKVAADITSGHAGLSLSASGIAFLAGYGAPVFFRMLDKLIGWVFDAGTDRRPVSGVQPPPSA